MSISTALTVKICGISTEETLDATVAAGADMVGFMFFPRSPRNVTPARAGELAARARGSIAIVAVTVDMDDAGLGAIVETVRPDWLQFHGRETPERVAEVRARYGLPIMKALHVAETADLAAITAYERAADRLLLEAKPPKDAVLPGGNGLTFDWRILSGFRPRTPYMLSGGLGPVNVVEALRISGAPGVDVSSGVESAPGVKDSNLIRAFIAAARAAAAGAQQERAAP